jgi:hypothetical protein
MTQESQWSDTVICPWCGAYGEEEMYISDTAYECHKCHKDYEVAVHFLVTKSLWQED